jgi:cytochrome b
MKADSNQNQSSGNPTEQETGIPTTLGNSIRVWDIPTRLFHWSLVGLLSISCYTGLTGGFYEMDYHMLSGYGILTLVTFRVLWGLAGTHYARFREFLPRPRQIKTHLGSVLKKPHAGAGHTPLGALNIVFILIFIFIQAGTGLFANDDIFTEGPLASTVSPETSSWLTGIHELNIWFLGACIVMHLLAIALNQFYFRENLVKAMLVGDKQANDIHVPLSIYHEIILGSLILCFSALGVYLLINY